VRLLTIEELRKEGQGLGRERFLAKHTSPFLVLDALGDDRDAEGFATVGGGNRRPRAPGVRKGDMPLPRTRAAAIQKREGANDFANMITVGRAGNNDILLEVSSVSKFHAYFTHDSSDGRWYLHDAGSSNGTWIDGERLGGSHGKAALHDGAQVQLGPDARARFYEAAALFELIAEKKK
jgi:hypothetical protein